MHWPLFTIVSLILIAPFTVLTSVFAIEVFVGLFRPRAKAIVNSDIGDVVILTPANDEALVIERTIADLRAQLPDGFRLLVVADNCSDDTATLARSAGAVVIERQDARRRGKGFALDHARNHLRDTAPPAVVIILDADCRIDRQSLVALAGAAAASGHPAQAINLLAPDLTAAPMVQVSNFAFLIKNLFRQRGLARLSGRVHLTGTGMALPWSLFGKAKLATDDIVEDMSMGLEFAEQGYFPVFVEDATVWSNASTGEGTRKQRARWEGGFIANSLRHGVPDLLKALFSLNPQAIWAALSLLVPPITLLAMIDIVALIAAIALHFAGALLLAPAILLCAVLVAFVATFAAWLAEGRSFLSAGAAIRMPAYILWKIPLYFGLLRGKRKTWVRTGR